MKNIGNEHKLKGKYSIGKFMIIKNELICSRNGGGGGVNN
jgi:hypothetical protein